MAFTDKQLAYIGFHLESLHRRGYLTPPEDTFRNGAYDPELELLVTGDLTLEGATSVNKDGQAVATTESLLGKVILAYGKLSPENIDDSLGISEVGGISFRGNEQTKREKIYNYHRQRLAQALDINLDKGCSRVGY